MRALLVGSYGAGNMGDEALKEYFLRTYPSIDWIVASAHPQRGETAHLPVGIRSLFRPWWRTAAAIRRADAIVFGGGSLFTDTESVMACIVWWWYTMMLRLFRLPLHFAFQGIGPFRTRLGERLARSAFRYAVSVSVRDAASLARVERWGLNTKIVLTFDPIFKLIEAKNNDSSIKKMIAIIPRMNSGELLLERARSLLARESWKEVRILSLQPAHPGEQCICRSLREYAPDALVLPVHTLEELIHSLEDVSCVLSERYHGALAALALGKECVIVCQRAGDKLSALQDLIADGVRPEDLFAAVEWGEDALRRNLSSVR